MLVYPLVHRKSSLGVRWQLTSRRHHSHLLNLHLMYHRNVLWLRNLAFQSQHLLLNHSSKPAYTGRLFLNIKFLVYLVSIHFLSLFTCFYYTLFNQFLCSVFMFCSYFDCMYYFWFCCFYIDCVYCFICSVKHFVTVLKKCYLHTFLLFNNFIELNWITLHH